MKSKRSLRWMVLAAATAGLLVVAACSSSSPTATPAPPASGGAPQGNVAANADAGRVVSLPIVGGSQQVGVWVNGSGSVLTAPDVGVLNFGVEARDTTVAPARDAAARAMDAALRALKAAGVQDKDIHTTNFSVQPIIVYRQTTPPGGQQTPVITGYVVSNGATAKVRDLNKFGDVIDAVAKAGGDAIRINGVGFQVDDPKPLETQARDLAMKDAQAKAQQMARAAGITLGAPVHISESGGSPIIFNQKVGIASGAAGADFAPTPISPGESQVTISVQVVYAIK